MIDLKLNDCFEEFKNMKNDSVDVSFTSPPYNSVRHKKYDNYEDDLDDYYDFLCKVTEELIRVTKRNVIINVQTNYYNKSDVYKYIGKYNEQIKRIIIWNKTNPQPSSMRHKLTNSYEMFIIFSKEPSISINSIFMKDVITTSINSLKIKGHKAVMNKEVAYKIIEELSKENETVLDCFMGSGTTGVVCKELKRNFIGIEIDENYLKIAKERLEKSNIGQTSLFDYKVNKNGQ